MAVKLSSRAARDEYVASLRRPPTVVPSAPSWEGFGSSFWYQPLGVSGRRDEYGIVRVVDVNRHICDRPRIAGEGLPRVVGTIVPPAHVVGIGDLWKCRECRQLWKVRPACDACDVKGHDRAHGGMCTVGLTWRPTYSWRDKRRYKKASR